MIGGLPATCLPPASGFGMRNEVHMGRIEPHEKWFSSFMLPLDKIFGC
jgi:hypothetical protein